MRRNPRATTFKTRSAGQVKTLMDSIAENAPACKDGAKAANARLADLVGAFDRLGFRVLELETNGVDFDLKIRDCGDAGGN